MFTRPPPFFPKPPMIHAFQSQDANQNLGFFAPFPDRSEDWGSIRDKADYTDSSREPNHEKVFLGNGSDNSRYYSASYMTGMKRPRDDWNDHLDVPIKKARDGGGLGGTEDDNLPYQCIDYGHRKHGSSMYDSAMGQRSLQKYKSGLQDKDLPNNFKMNDQEFFQLFEDGLDLMIQTDDSIRAILEFDTRLNWILSPIFKDQDIDAVTQLLGQGEEAVAAKKLEKMVWLTKTKIQCLCSEILENVSVMRKEAVEQTKYITKPVPSLNNPENQISHGIDDSKEHLKFGRNPTPSYRDDQLMSQDFRRPPDLHNQGSFVPDVCQQIQLIPREFPLPPDGMSRCPLPPFTMPPPRPPRRRVIPLVSEKTEEQPQILCESKLITHIKKIQNVLASQNDGCDLPEVLLHKINKSFTEPLLLYLVIKKVKRSNSCLYFMAKVMLDACILARVYTPSVETASEMAYISAMQRIKNMSAIKIAHEKGLEVVDELSYGKESEKDFPLSIKKRFEKIMALIKKKPTFLERNKKKNYLNKIAAQYNLPHSLVYPRIHKKDYKVPCDLYLGGVFVAHSEGSSVRHARVSVYGNAWYILCNKPFGFIKCKDRWQRFRKLSMSKEQIENTKSLTATPDLTNQFSKENKKEHHERSASALCPKEEFGNDKHLSQTEATK